MVWLQGLKLSKDEMDSVFQMKLELGSEARTLDSLAGPSLRLAPQAVAATLPLSWDFSLPVKPDGEPVLGSLGPRAWGGSGDVWEGGLDASDVTLALCHEAAVSRPLDVCMQVCTNMVHPGALFCFCRYIILQCSGTGNTFAYMELLSLVPVGFKLWAG